MRDLPDEIQPFAVTHNLKVKVQDSNLNSQITSQNSKIYREILKGNGGVFQQFGWMKDEYGIQHLLEQEEIHNEKLRMEKVNRLPFNRATLKKVMKYEYPFLGKGETSTRNFLLAEDPYSVGKTDALRAHWIEEVKQLYGAFRPSGPAHPIHTVSKSLMREIVDVVKRLLLSDWNDVNFVLGSKYPLDL